MQSGLTYREVRHIKKTARVTVGLGRLPELPPFSVSATQRGYSPSEHPAGFTLESRALPPRPILRNSLAR
jgi:hypothetical protein